MAGLTFYMAGTPLDAGSRNYAYASENIFPMYPGAPSTTPRIIGAVSPITVSTNGDVSFMYDLEGLDARCSNGAGSAANSCGIHIHEGTCGNAGNHYYNQQTISQDPWANINYSTGEGQTFETTTRGWLRARVTSPLTVNIGTPEISGRTFVLHDYDGNRVGCQVISSPPTNSKPLSAYPGLTCNTALSNLRRFFSSLLAPVRCRCVRVPKVLRIRGGALCAGLRAPHRHRRRPNHHLQLRTLGRRPGLRSRCAAERGLRQCPPSHQSGALSLQLLRHCVDGAGPRVGVANSCGLHIHQGTDCSVPVGSHYYFALLASDPWARVTYQTSQTIPGYAHSTASLNVGFPASQLLGHVSAAHVAAGGGAALSLAFSFARVVGCRSRAREGAPPSR